MKHKERKDDGDETYCVAWFHPDGMRVKQLTTPLQNASSKLSMLSSQAKDNSTMNLLGASSVLYQWDGYSEAIDVFSPFGYSRSLLRVSSILAK